MVEYTMFESISNNLKKLVRVPVGCGLPKYYDEQTHFEYGGKQIIPTTSFGSTGPILNLRSEGKHSMRLRIQHTAHL